MAWKGVPWLQSARVLYWGDLDAHGFAILSRLRGFVPGVRSFLMDRSVLEGHWNLAVPDEMPAPSFDWRMLTCEEYAVWELLRERRLRLEQERIPMAVVHASIIASGAASGSFGQEK